MGLHHSTLRAVVLTVLLSCRCDGGLLLLHHHYIIIIFINVEQPIVRIIYSTEDRPVSQNMCVTVQNFWCVDLGRSMVEGFRYKFSHAAPEVHPVRWTPVPFLMFQTAVPAICTGQNWQIVDSCRDASTYIFVIELRRMCAESVPPCCGWRSRGHVNPTIPNCKICGSVLWVRSTTCSFQTQFRTSANKI